MSNTVQWDNDEKTVLRWTWDEFSIAFKQGADMMASLDHPVHFIVNPLNTISRGYLPPGALQNTLSLYRNALPNAGSTVMIGGSFSAPCTGSARRFIRVLPFATVLSTGWKKPAPFCQKRPIGW
jgi:hypothetical protein